MDCNFFTIFAHCTPRAIILSVCFVLGSSNFALAATSSVELSESEKQWLSEHPSIRLAVDIDWLPFEAIDENSNYIGMAAEYLALVSEKLGVEFVPEKDKRWSEVVELVRTHELDMYSCVLSTDQRREYAIFTEPYLSFPMVIVTGNLTPYVENLESLAGQSVAVVRGYASHELLDRNHADINLVLYDNVSDALQDLSFGRVYAYVGNIASVDDVIRRSGITNVKISGQTPYKYELSMAVRNDWPELVPILQKALDSITDQEADQIYQNWIKLQYVQRNNYAMYWKVLTAAFVLVLFVSIWNRRLTREIQKRNDAEKLACDAQLKLEENNKQLLNYVEIVDKYVITSSTDKRGTIVSTSSAFCTISGYSEKELIGSNHRVVRDRDMPDSIYVELWSTITRGKTWQGELRNKKKNGELYWVYAYISPNFDEKGDIIGFTAIREDITSQKLAHELAVTDELTSLFNRRHFNAVFPLELARAQRAKEFIGLMIIDVDHFKPYNDNYGHFEGDVALKAVAKALQDALRRPSDYAFRIGGEEFAAIVTAKSNEDIINTAEHLREAVANLKIKHAYSQASSCVTVSIGLKIHDSRGVQPLNLDVIYRFADEALYQAKESGRNRVVKHSTAGAIKQLIDQTENTQNLSRTQGPEQALRN